MFKFFFSPVLVIYIYLYTFMHTYICIYFHTKAHTHIYKSNKCKFYSKIDCPVSSGKQIDYVHQKINQNRQKKH